MELKDISKEIAGIARQYQYPPTPPYLRELTEKLARLLRQLADWLHDLFHPTQSALDSHSISTMLQIAIWAAGVIGLLLATVAIVRGMRNASRAVAEKTRGATAVEELLSASGWKKQASKLAGVSDFKGACRALYLSLLQDMHEHGVAEFAPAKTNYEYGYLLAKYPEIQSQFKCLAQKVEVIWFGNGGADSHDYEQSLTDVEALHQQIRLVANKTDASVKEQRGGSHE